MFAFGRMCCKIRREIAVKLEIDDMKRIFIILAVSAVATLSYGSLLFEDNFSYSDGSLTNVSSGTWVKYSGTNDPSTPMVSGGAIILDRGNSDDVYREGSASQIDSGTIYYSFDMTMNTKPATSSDGYYLAGLGRGTTTLRDRLYVTTAGAAEGDYFQIGVGNNSMGVKWASDLSLSTTYRIVVGSNLGTDQTTLWIDPENESSTSVSVIDADTYAIQGLQFRQDTGIGISEIDNARLATTFSEAIPEPSTLTLVAVIGLVAILRRKLHG
jgi:hypothetical protein